MAVLFSKNAEHLDAAIKAVCPIEGVSLGVAPPGTVRIDFAPEVPEGDPRRLSAQDVVAGFNFSDAAEQARTNLVQRRRAVEALASPRTEHKSARARDLVLLREINLVRAALVPPLPARTREWLRNEIRDVLNMGTVD